MHCNLMALKCIYLLNNFCNNFLLDETIAKYIHGLLTIQHVVLCQCSRKISVKLVKVHLKRVGSLQCCGWSSVLVFPKLNVQCMYLPVGAAEQVDPKQVSGTNGTTNGIIEVFTLKVRHCPTSVRRNKCNLLNPKLKK